MEMDKMYKNNRFSLMISQNKINKVEFNRLTEDKIFPSKFSIFRKSSVQIRVCIDKILIVLKIKASSVLLD